MTTSAHIISQEDLEIFAWKSFLPYKTGKWVTQSENSIIYAAEKSLLFIAKEDLSLRFMSKEDGLSDIDIEKVLYNTYQEQLIVIYSNNNIDFISEDGVFNVPDIKNNTTIIGSKKINDVHISGSNRILFATDFGIIDYRADRLEFGTTIFTNLKVHEISTNGKEIFAATDDGLYYFLDDGSRNFADFGQWQLLGADHGLPTLYEAKSIGVFSGHFYMTDGRSIYLRNEGVFTEIYREPDNKYDITFLSEGIHYLMVGLRAPNKSRIMYYDGVSLVEGDNGCIDRIKYCVEDENGQVWFADAFRKFRYNQRIDGGCQKLDFNSPLSPDVSDIAVNDEVIVASSGGVSDNYTDLYERDGLYLFADDKWKNINENNYGPIKDNGMLSFHKVEISPDGEKIIFASFWNGILEYDLVTGESRFFGEDNSALQIAFGDKRVRVSDVKYDESGNLWITNFFAARPLVVYTAEEDWYSFPISGDRRLGDMAIDKYGNIWMVTLGSSAGIFVYNPGSDLANTQDDQRRVFNLNNSEITSSTIFTVESDLNGDVWIGTAEGAIVFDCGGDVFGDDCLGNRPKVEVDSILAFLLETEEVGAIAIDGGNRKWFGTRNGIFVQSPQGDKQIARFTTDNSPLFDNQIVDLTFDGNTGLMYIATNDGLQAVRTETTLGRSVHANQVYTFPNPVPPQYNGPIAIKGLAQNANVKITDLSGRIVFETSALGGQAIWYGEDLDGNRAKTGVYLVFSTGQTNFGSPDSYVSKILLVNE